MKLDPRVYHVIEKVAEREGIELVHAEMAGDRRPTLKVLIDKPGGVTLDDCATISRKLGLTLDVEDLIPYRYLLEVASPGLDRGLYKESDYERFAGLPAHIRLDAPVDGQRTFHGTLIGLDRSEQVAAILEESGGLRHRFPLARIARAHVEIEP
jgi:ribosome maturation factor RimP